MRARLALALAAAVAPLALAAAVFAHDGPHDEGSAHESGAPGAAGAPASPAQDPEAAARAALADARTRLARAEAAYSLMMSRNFPRGDARGEIVKERDAARAEWERLAAAHPDLAKQLQAGSDGS